MPTTATNTYTNDYLQPAVPKEEYPALVMVDKFKASVTIAKGTILGRVTATGRLAAYSNANSDGTETAVAIAKYAITTDANGDVTNLNNLGVASKTAPVYYSGAFRTEDLTGLDANAVTDFGGRIPVGNTTTGLLLI